MHHYVRFWQIGSQMLTSYSFNFHTIAYLPSIFIWLSQCAFLQHMTSYKYRVYGYYIYIAILLAIYIA